MAVGWWKKDGEKKFGKIFIPAWVAGGDEVICYDTVPKRELEHEVGIYPRSSTS